MRVWTQTSKRKLVGTLAFVCAMFVLIAVLGQFWITNSEPYELGRTEVGNRLGVPPDVVKLKRFASFEFTDGAYSGHAYFVLCGGAERCFTVVAEKRDARWSVVNLLER